MLGCAGGGDRLSTADAFVEHPAEIARVQKRIDERDERCNAVDGQFITLQERASQARSTG